LFAFLGTASAFVRLCNPPTCLWEGFANWQQDEDETSRHRSFNFEAQGRRNLVGVAGSVVPRENLEISEQMGVIPPSQFSPLPILVPRPHFAGARTSLL
jgi:hypothetical protein